MSGIIPWLSGASGAASNAGSYYQNALSQLLGLNGQSGLAEKFIAEQNAGLQPQFQKQNQGMIAQENALGIGRSGAGRAGLGDLTAQQSGTLASVAAPLYQSEMGGAVNLLDQMPGAQNTAYQNAIQNFYSGISDAGSLAAGLPPSAQTSGGGSFTPSYTGDPATTSTEQQVGAYPAYAAAPNAPPDSAYTDYTQGLNYGSGAQDYAQPTGYGN